MIRCLLPILAFCPWLLSAQQAIRIKRVDNSFLFFQANTKSDTLIGHKSDLFRIHFPDSLQHRLVIHLRNGQFTKSTNDSLFRLVYIPGMKYSLSKPDTAYISLLEGICDPEKLISIEIHNLKTGSIVQRSTFLVN